MSDPTDDKLRQDLMAAYGRDLPGEEFDRRIMDRIDLASGEQELSVPAPEATRIWPWVLGAAAVLLLIAGAPFAWKAGKELLPDSTLTPVGLPQAVPPAPAVPADSKLIIEAKIDGTFWIKGKAYAVDELRRELKSYADRAKAKAGEDGEPEPVEVLIRADKGVRWRVLQKIMEACADPAVGIFDLQFATAKDGEEPYEEPRVVEGEVVYPDGTRVVGEIGKVGEFPKLPIELKRSKEEETTRVYFRDEEIGVGDAGFDALDRVLANLPDFLREFSGARLEASVSVPHDDVVRAIDALMQVGITDITFVGVPPPKDLPRFAVVQRGDTLFDIAERWLGNGRRWPEIAAVNPGINSDELRLGQKIRLPDDAPKVPAAAPAPRDSVRIDVFIKDGEKFATLGGEKVHTLDEALKILDRNLAWYEGRQQPVGGMIGAGSLLTQEDYDRIMAIFRKHGVKDVTLIR